MDRRGGETMDDLSIMALDIIKTIKREDKFYEAKRNGGFVKHFQVKEFDGVS